jgi:uncharacterized protein (DUF433 family)
VDWREHIELNPAVLAGKPVIKGTRLAVEFVMEMLGAGVSESQILANYPRLPQEAIRACISYATEVLKSERVFPLSV